MDNAFSDILHVLTLRDYNTRLVVLSTAILGAAAGLIGTFLLLRKRALMGDALSHATLPGIALAFLLMVALGGTGRALIGLLAGAAAFGLLGVGCVLAIKRLTRLKDDAALGIVLSVFFGFGVALLGIIQDLPQASAAGLATFIYGKTASIVLADLGLIGAAAAAVALACTAFYKEFALLCFDEQFAAAQGWGVTRLDVLMLTLVTAVTVIGLQSVGLILIVALLIIPAAAARFWTEHLARMMIAAAAIGAVSGWVGASLSALVPRLPAGAVIVVAAAAVFVLSMIFGASRGVLVRVIGHVRLVRKVGRQHLLRALYERAERSEAGCERSEVSGQESEVRGQRSEVRGGGDPIAGRLRRPGSTGFDELLAMRSWSPRRLRRLLRRGQREGLVAIEAGGGAWRLTDAGRRAAARVVRNHRLWEMYLIAHADIAPSHVDRDADAIEHVLGRDMVAELERLLGPTRPADGPEAVPPSPHAL